MIWLVVRTLLARETQHVKPVHHVRITSLSGSSLLTFYLCVSRPLWDRSTKEKKKKYTTNRYHKPTLTLPPGFDGTVGVSRVCGISQSSTLTFQFRQWADGSQAGIIPANHRGPCSVYLKKVSSAISDSGYGGGWFKIWESGYDESTQEWCTDRLIAANGLLSVEMPADLEGGSYLARPEVLALHEASTGDPQFYTGCAQVWLDSAATGGPGEATVAIPGYVQAGQESVSFNVWETPMDLPYPIPGPAVYENGAAGSLKREVHGHARVHARLHEKALATVEKRDTQTEGLKPEGCVVENGNWCGFEVASYTDQVGCWNVRILPTTVLFNLKPPSNSPH